MEPISFKSGKSQGNRLSIHLDAVGGISGDMFASAFLDLNPELMEAIKESVDEVGLGGELRVENKAFSDGVLKANIMQKNGCTSTLRRDYCYQSTL